ncbi:MAG: Hpt domain-containing protein [Planctomycetota bacterium]
MDDPAARRLEAEPPLRSSYSGDPEMRELVDYFIGDLERRMHALRAALDACDAARLRTLAHQLSGSAGGYGFAPIGDAAKRLEDHVRSLRTDDGLSDETALSAVRERAEDLIATCRRAIRTGDDA